VKRRGSPARLARLDRQPVHAPRDGDVQQAERHLQSNEIASHQQSTGATQGPGRIAGTLNGELSPGTYSLDMAALLRRDFATAFTAITAGLADHRRLRPDLHRHPRHRLVPDRWREEGHVVRLSVGA
jgi:hypothetical protein